MIAGEKDFQSTNLHTWFGLPKNWEVPMRLPALIIPALEIMRELKKSDITPPHFVVYQATSLISEINQIPREEALRVAAEMETTLFNFIKGNFPELVPHTSIYFWEKENEWEILDSIQRYAWDTNGLLTETSKSHFQSCETRNSNGNGKSLLYVTANSYYNGWFDEYPFPQAPDTNSIIPIWGHSEKAFFKILLETQTSCRDIFPLITQVGAFPTYYKNPRWDIMTEAELSQYDSWNTHLHPDIQKDLSVLSPYTI